jgi:diketogulonate reductase-like aldo/keto reductase
VAAHHGSTPAQIALAWVLGQQGVDAITRAVTPEHVHENRAAADLHLTVEELALPDRRIPTPDRPRPLEVV